MPPKSHSDGVNLVREWVSQHGLILPYTTGMFRKVDSERRVRVGRPGMSDTVACLKAGGKFAAIEVKVSDSDSQKPNQIKCQHAVEANGGIYLIADFRRGQDGIASLEADLRSLGVI